MMQLPESLEDFSRFLESRFSVRAFTRERLPLGLVEEVVRCARFAPSGANLQPGQFHVLAGEPLQGLSKVLLDAAANNAPIVEEYSYFPKPMSATLKSKQREAGFALYDACGIKKRDTQARRDQFNQNYRFFDAPVGIVVSIERGMGKGCYMDLGMAIMSLMLAARSAGLGCTGIGALANYANLVHRYLELPEQDLVVCGIALGYTEPNAAINQFRTSRDQLQTYATFEGFE